MCKNENEDINERIVQSKQQSRFPQNRFYGLRSSERPPASVGVESYIFVCHLQNAFSGNWIIGCKKVRIFLIGALA